MKYPLFATAVCLNALLLAMPASAQNMAQIFSQALAPVVKPGQALQPTGTSGLQTAANQLRSGQLAEAIATLNPLVNTENATTRAQSRYLLALAQSQQGSPAAALTTLEGTLSDTTTPMGRAVADLRGKLMLQAAEGALMAGATDQAARFLADYERVSSQPDQTRFKRLQFALNPRGDRVNTPLRVGVLVPQTGSLGAAGIDILRALQLGLPQFTAGGRKIELIVRDATTPTQTAEAAAFLRAQKVALVVGPLLAPSVAEAARELGSIPLLTLSSDASVLAPQVHTLNFLPGQQVTAVATMAIAQGRKRFAALIPQGTYGEATLAGLRTAATAGGAQVTKTSFFNPNDTDIGASIRELGTGFEALLIPTPGRTLPLIASQLAFYDLDKAGIQLLGTALWQAPEDQASLLNPSANAVRGGLFAAPSRNSAFTSLFTQTYGAAPHPLAALGYDAAAILSQLGLENARTGNNVAQLLLRPEGFYAPGGYAQFKPNGQTERSLSVTQITENQGSSQFTERTRALPLAPLPLPTPLIPAASAGGWW